MMCTAHFARCWEVHLREGAYFALLFPLHSPFIPLSLSTLDTWTLIWPTSWCVRQNEAGGACLSLHSRFTLSLLRPAVPWLHVPALSPPGRVCHPSLPLAPWFVLFAPPLASFFVHVVCPLSSRWLPSLCRPPPLNGSPAYCCCPLVRSPPPRTGPCSLVGHPHSCPPLVLALGFLHPPLLSQALWVVYTALALLDSVVYAGACLALLALGYMYFQLCTPARVGSCDPLFVGRAPLFMLSSSCGYLCHNMSALIGSLLYLLLLVYVLHLINSTNIVIWQL